MVRFFQFSKYFFMTLAAMFLAMPAFAQSGGATAPGYFAIAVGIGMGIAAGGCADSARVAPQLRRLRRSHATPARVREYSCSSSSASRSSSR